jgi:MFS transporter, FHS family, L-fucose permease
MERNTILDAEDNRKSSLLPTILIGTLFFIFGFVTWLNATLIPYLKIACQLDPSEAFLVAGAFYIAYFFTAIPSSFVLQKTGFKKGMMLGLLIMALGALVFIPAAQSRTFGLFLTGLFIIATGLSLLQTASNPYVTIVGPIESAAKRISIMGICNKMAGTIAPVILGAVILSDADVLESKLKVLNEVQKTAMLDELASRVILPYSIMAIVLTTLALLVRYSPLPEIEAEEGVSEGFSTSDSRTSVFQFPQLVLGTLSIFVYVGVEVLAGDSISLFGQHEGIALSAAKNFPSFTLIAMVVGYIGGIFTIPRYISQEKALAFSCIVGIIFSILAIFTNGYTAVLFIALLGLAHALMWPAIWPLAIHGLGKFTKTGSAMLIMAIAGGAFIPWLYGKIAEMPGVGLQKAYWIFIPCYLFILYFSLKGHKLKKF